VNSPEQRRLGVKDSVDLAWQDWLGSAQFDRLGSLGEDEWALRWARAYVEFAAGEKRSWPRTTHPVAWPRTATSSATSS
jgi:predicted oxidoreductase